MAEVAWDELLKNPLLIGGDLVWNTGPQHYCGNITRIRDYGNRMTFHFSWAAARLGNRWSQRAVRKTTLYKKDLRQTDSKGKPFEFGGHKIYLKGTGHLTEDEVTEKITHHKRQKRSSDSGPGPLFS